MQHDAPVWNTLQSAKEYAVVNFWEKWIPTFQSLVADARGLHADIAGSQWAAMYKDAFQGRVDNQDHEAWQALAKITGSTSEDLLPLSLQCMPSSNKKHLNMLQRLEEQAAAFATSSQTVVQTANALGKIKEMMLIDATSQKHRVMAQAAGFCGLVMKHAPEGNAAYMEHGQVFCDKAASFRAEVVRYGARVIQESNKNNYNWKTSRDGRTITITILTMAKRSNYNEYSSNDDKAT